MKNYYQHLKVVALTLVSVMSMSSASLAITLKVTVKNLAPNQGVALAQVWFGLHNGNFDLFDAGGKAPSQLGLLARDGLVGLEQYVPGLVQDAIAAGLNINGLPPDISGAILGGLDLSTLPPPGSTVAGLFFQSPSGQVGGTQGIAYANTREPFFIGQLPQTEISTKVTIDDHNILNNRFFSYAAMAFPSNDAFIGNDNSTSIPIFNSQGKFLGANFTVQGNEVWDAGVEVNDESPLHVPYSLSVFGIGTPEDLPIRLHPGFLAAGDGGVADFQFKGQNVFGQVPNFRSSPLVQITITTVPEPSVTLGLFLLCGLGWLVKPRHPQ